MSRKLPHQISLEELLSSLEAVKDDIIDNTLISYSNDIPFFLSKFKLETGKYLVRPSMLYKLYKIYSQEPLSIYSFSREVGNFIKREGNYFCINISAQKVIKILNPAQNQQQMASSSMQKHFAAFIENKQIKKGNKLVEAFILYEIYRLYCIDYKVKKRLRYEYFVSICRLHFEYRRIGSSKQNWLKLDPSMLDLLTPEELTRIKHDRKPKKARKIRKKE